MKGNAMLRVRLRTGNPQRVLNGVSSSWGHNILNQRKTSFFWKNQEEIIIGLCEVMRENWEKRWKDGGMIKWLGEDKENF
jgi:hypothetical protein